MSELTGPQAQMIELPEVTGQTTSGPALLSGNLGLLDGLKVSLNVQIGQVHTTIGELMDLKEACILKTDRDVDYPVDVILNGNVVARGQLVVVGDNFAVRISEVAKAAA